MVPRPAIVTSRTEEGPLLVFSVGFVVGMFGALAADVARVFLGLVLVLVLLSRADSLVRSDLMGFLVLVPRESLDFSQEETLESDLVSLEDEGGPVMVVSVVPVWTVSSANDLIGFAGSAAFADGTAFADSVLNVGGMVSLTSPVLGAGIGGATPEVSGSSLSVGAENTRAATSSAGLKEEDVAVVSCVAILPSPTGSPVVVTVETGTSGDSDSSSDVNSCSGSSAETGSSSGSSADIGSTLGMGARTGGSVAVTGLSVGTIVLVLEDADASLALRFSSSRTRLSSAFFAFSSSFLALASRFSSSMNNQHC